MTLTKQDFIDDPIGTIYHTSRGAHPCMRWRKNGKVKTWKRTPEMFKVPVKHGLYVYDYITPDNANLITHREKDCDHA